MTVDPTASIQNASVVVSGNRISLRAWHTDTYEKLSGRWQGVWSQVTETK